MPLIFGGKVFGNVAAKKLQRKPQGSDVRDPFAARRLMVCIVVVKANCWNMLDLDHRPSRRIRALDLARGLQMRDHFRKQNPAQALEGKYLCDSRG